MFDFNTYSALLLPAFINGLLFSVLCLVRFYKERQLCDFFLGILLLLLAIRLSFWMLGFAGWYDRHDGFTTFMFYFPFNTLLWIGPCLYFYFQSLTNRDFRFTWRHWPHLLLPTLLLLLYVGKFVVDFTYYRPFPQTEQYQFGTRGPFAELDKEDLVYLLSYLSLLFYFVLVLKQFRNYRRYLANHFSDLKGVSLGWLSRLIVFTAIAVLFLFVFYIAEHFFALSYTLNWYPYLLLGLLIYYISINGYFYSPGLFRFVQFSNDGNNNPPKNFQLSDLELWKQNLSELMDIEQPYLDAELTLSSLARKLKTNTQILSKIINEGYGQNFNDYVNAQRVNAVIEQFKTNSHKQFSLMGIAYDCGFNSKTTFNRAFKKATGQTPSDYIRKLEGSNHNMNL